MARYQSAATGEGTFPTRLCSFVRAPGNRAAAPFQPHNSETDVTLPATDSTRPATVAFNFGVSTWHVEVFGIPEVWLSAQLHNLRRDNLLLTRQERCMSTDNPCYVKGHLLPRHVPAQASLADLSVWFSSCLSSELRRQKKKRSYTYHCILLQK